MVNSEIEIITDWNKNLENRPTEEPDEPEQTIPDNSIKESLEKYDNQIEVIEQQIYVEERNLTELKELLNKAENDKKENEEKKKNFH